MQYYIIRFTAYSQNNGFYSIFYKIRQSPVLDFLLTLLEVCCASDFNRRFLDILRDLV